MSLRRIPWGWLADEQGTARLAGIALTAMLCSGLLLRRPWLAQTIDWVVLLPVGIWLLWLAGRSQRVDRNPNYRVIVVGLACYLAALLLSTAAADLPAEHGMVQHLWAALLCLLSVAILAQAHRYDRSLARYLGLSVSLSAAAAALVLIAASLWDGVLGHGRLKGLLELNWVLNPNALGGVYAVCYAVSVGHSLRRDISRWERTLTLGISLLPLGIVALTQSRGAMLGCLAAITVAVLASPPRVSLTVCALVAAAATVAAIAFPEWVHLIFSRTISTRITLWLHFLELSRDQLWLGRGLDFDPRFQIDKTTIYTPHNILMAALVRGGIAGLASLVLTLAGAVVAAVAAARQGWWLPLTVLASSLVLSAVDHEIVPTTFGFYWYLFWLPLGLTAAAALTPSSNPAAMDRLAEATT